MSDQTLSTGNGTGAAAETRQTVRLTAAQALVRYLQQQFSERDGEVRRAVPAIFGIFGHGNVAGLGQAIQQDGHELPLYQPKNEQAMVHTALGYAKATRRLATFACTASIGPGATNLITGAATATVNRLPVLLLPSDTFANRRQGPVLQQLEHPTEADASVNDAFRPVSRYFDRITRPEQLLTALPEAMRVLLDPADTGAVTISLHQDVQGEAYDFPVEFFATRRWPVTRRPPAESELSAAVSQLVNCERPLIIVGGGVRHSAAEDAVHRFATEFGIPVVETSAGKGAIADCPLLLGGIGVNGTVAANETAAEADLVLCVGTRLTDFTTGSHSLFQDPEVRFIGINANAADAYKLSATPIVADAREAITGLHGRLEVAGWSAPSGHAEDVVRRRRSWEESVGDLVADADDSHLRQVDVIEALNTSVRPGDWIVAAAGYQPGDLLKLWRPVRGVRTHIEFGFSCMGHEIPAALGIRMREGDRDEVIVFIGDGTYLMNPTELVTAVQEKLKLTVVVVTNGGYRSISDLAIGKSGSSAGNELRHRRPGERLLDGGNLEIDYVANAQSMGCRGVLACTPGELAAALRTARSQPDTTVIVCPVDGSRQVPDSEAFWDIGVPQVATDPAAADAAARHRAAARVQRHY